jgi:hypothetical protein
VEELKSKPTLRVAVGKVLKQEYSNTLLEVLPKGEKLNLAPMVIMPEGRNLRMEATGHLEDSINEMCLQIWFLWENG